MNVRMDICDPLY